MKKHINYLFIIALAACAWACTEEQPTDKEILDSRTSSKLEVSYSASGSPISALSFTHNAIRKEIEVNVNNENLSWNLESNRDWCKVVPGEHKGTGAITLQISANEEFEAREQATLTFVAGEFRGFRITVNQSASAFILGQPYFLTPIAGEATTSKVTTISGTDWDFSAPDWLTVSKGATASADGFSVTTLNISSSANDGKSRYGAIELASGAEKDYIYVYQFGTELEYDAGGNIYFPSGTPATLTFPAPAFMVGDIQLPGYAKGEVTENGDGTATVTITIDDNLSDCGEVREVDIALTLTNASASIVKLPKLVQDYVPAHGLVTGKGMVAFAKAIADGTSTADWQQDGVVRVIQDIDMNGIAGWTGIGTSSKPFTGTFDGGGHTINFPAGTSAGLFNFCKGANVKNVVLGKGTSIYNNSEFMGAAYFGGIVSHAESTSISDCTFAGDLEYSGTSDDEGTVCVGGILGWGDASSSVKSCKMSGKVLVSSASSPEVICYLGGIVGLAKGSLTASEVSGEVKFSSALETVLMGGVTSSLIEGATAGNNSFNGKLVLSGNAKEATLGGLYGRVDSDRTFDVGTDKSITIGEISLDSFLNDNVNTHIYAGGFIGKIQPGVALTAKGYETQTTIHLDLSQNITTHYICLGGFLGSCDPVEAAKSVSFEDITNSGSITLLYSTTSTVGARMRHGHFGGIAGYINCGGSVKSCTNQGAIGAADSAGNVRCAASSNDYNEIIGGIIGCAKGGSLTIESCLNAAPITNLHYSNRPSTATYDGMFSSQAAGGILGAFSYFEADAAASLTIKSCINSDKGQVLNFRGYAGGIVGYCQNATITDCNSSGAQAAASNDNAYYRGGIAGGIRKSTIKNSWASCPITSGSGGSAEAAFSGGIAGWVKSDDLVTIENCSYYGVLKSATSTTKPSYPGGILGAGVENTVIKDCKYGGSIQGIDINDNNVAAKKNVIGNETGNISGITYWNGKQ
jgi:hypothetical protein